MRKYFVYKVKYEVDGVHFTNPFQTWLLTNSWIDFTYSFVAQNWEDILAYLEYDSNNEITIRDVINNSTITTDYQIIEKTVQEASDFINLAYWTEVLTNEIVWDTINFTLKEPLY